MLCGVVRHAERADVGFGLVDGSFWLNSPDNVAWPYDPPLSDDAIEQSQELAQRIASFAQEHESRFHVVVTSPYKRCIQTALAITSALGDDVSMLVDRSLGEVYNSETLGSVEQPVSVVRPVEGWQAASHGDVDCICQAIGKWPEWNETVDEARFRYANGFLSYLRRGADTSTNFLLVTHMEGVAASFSMLPSSAEKCVTSVGYGGMFLAKASAIVQAEITKACGGSADVQGNPECPMVPTPSNGWKVKTSNVKTRRAAGRNTLLMKTLESSSMDVDDIKALLSTGVRASLTAYAERKASYLSNDTLNAQSDGDELSDDEHTESMLRQKSEAFQAFARKRNSGTVMPKSPSQYPCNPGIDPLCSVKLLQREWGSERSVVLCDGRRQGCPIFHASEGFLKLFGFTVEECSGVQCGLLTRPDPLLEALVWPSRLHIRKLQADMLQGCIQTGFALLLNRKRSGCLFINELVMRTHRCPMTGAPFLIGVQCDAEMPIPKFMEYCTSPQAYTALLETYKEKLSKRVSDLPLDCENVLSEIFKMTQTALHEDSHSETPNSASFSSNEQLPLDEQSVQVPKTVSGDEQTHLQLDKESTQVPEGCVATGGGKFEGRLNSPPSLTTGGGKRSRFQLDTKCTRVPKGCMGADCVTVC